MDEVIQSGFNYLEELSKQKLIENDKKKTCCENEYIVLIHGIYICQSCGLEQGCEIVSNFEGADYNPNFNGCNFVMNLIFKNKPFYGSNTNNKSSKLCFWRNDYDSEVVTFYKAYKDIQELFGSITSKNITDCATLLFMKFTRIKKRGFKKHNRKCLFAVCLYLAFIENNSVRQKKEIIKLVNCSIGEFEKMLHLYITQIGENGHTTPISPSPEDYINMFLDRMKVQNRLKKEKLIFIIYKNVEKYNHIYYTMNFATIGLIAGCLFYTIAELDGRSINDKTAEEFNNITNISKSVLLLVAKEIKKNEQIILNLTKMNDIKF